jgi:hypothetical protein
MKHITTIKDKVSGVTTRWFDARTNYSAPIEGLENGDCIICNNWDNELYVNWVNNGALFGIHTFPSLGVQFETIKSSWEMTAHNFKVDYIVWKSGPAFEPLAGEPEFEDNILQRQSEMDDAEYEDYLNTVDDAAGRP